VLDFVQGQMTTNESSPVMARAPLLLSESMIFPYSEGLSFEQDIWMDQGQAAAFAGTLDRPPTSSWEIMNPREYEHKHIPAVPLLPNIHPLTDPLYEPYDIGQMGQLDVKILTELFGGDNAARDLTPAWDGGLYWAGQLHSAKTPEEQASTKSLALFYLSIWKNADSAQVFAKLYADSLGRKYSNLKMVSNDASSQSSSNGSVGKSGDQEQVFSTDEGPVIITQRGKMVFVAESFPLPVARKLTTLIFDAQGSGVLRMAQSDPDIVGTQSPGSSQTGLSLWGGSRLRMGGGETSAVTTATYQPLTGDLVQFFQNCGVMKAAVDGAMAGSVRSVRSPLGVTP